MSRITVQGLSKHFSGDDLFTDLSFEVLEGMRLAVAGPNGCGKSTLLRIIAGELDHDGGSITMSKGARLGYVAQELSEADLEDVLLGWVLSALPSWSDFWRKWECAVEEKDENRLQILSAEQADFESRYGYNPEHRARTILMGLGFAEEDLCKQLGELSGGWRERAKLGRVLLQGADVLLLDEPTNHLDLEAVEWLEEYLLGYRGSLVFVAHDRVFLERVGTHVLFLGGDRPVLRKGSFSEFLAWEEENADLRSKEAAKLSAKIDHERDYIRRFRVKARKAAQAQSKLKKVEKMEDELARIKAEQNQGKAGRSLAFRLPEPLRGDKVPVAAVDLEFHYGDGCPVWPKLDFQIYRGKKIVLSAPNGAGKSTLIKLITGQLQPTHGHVKIGQNTSLGYFSQHQTDILNPTGTVLGEIRRLSDPKMTEEQLMGTLGLFLLGESYFERLVAALSGGEKNRLILASLFLRRANFLLLDEPTNHLDLESRMGLVAALKDYEGTLFMVAHDRYLLSEVAEEFWVFDGKGITPFQGDFDEFMVFRKELLAGANPAEAKTKACAPDTEKVEKRKLTKEDKRRQADIRNKFSRELQPLQKEYDKLERDLEKVLADLGVIEERMNDPKTYEDPQAAIALNTEHRDATEWSESLMERMVGLEEKINDLTARREALLAETEA